MRPKGSDRVGEGSTGFEGRDSRVSTGGFRDSAPAASASGADAATGARGRVEVTVEAEPTPPKAKSSQRAKGHVKGQRSASPEGQRQRAQGCEDWCRQGRHQYADGEETAEAATHEGRSEGQSIRTERTECALQASGTCDGQGRRCEPGAEALAVGEENSPDRGRTPCGAPPLGRRDGLSKTTTGDKAEGADPGPKHHAERHQKLEEEAKPFAQLLERHSSPNQYEARFPQVDRKSRSHHPRGGGDYRQDQLYQPDADSPPAPASASAANWGDKGAGRNSSAGVAQQFLHGDRTRCTEDAGCSNSSPGDTRSINTAKDDAECQQEGKDLGGVGGESKGFARSGANGCGVDFSTGVSSSDQIGGTNHGQGGSSSEGQDVFPEKPPASSWGVLGRPLREDGAPRPCAAATFISPLPPAASMVGSASCLPIATATARDCSHSAAVVKMSAAGVEELGSEGPVEEGSYEGQVEQGSGVSPWMLAGDAAYLSKSELSTLQNEHVTCLAIPHTISCHL